MIEINLLPEEFKKKESKFRKADLSKFDPRNFPVIKIIFFGIAAFMAVHMLLFVMGSYAKSSIGSLRKKYETILPKKKEADMLKSQREAVNKKVGVIDELMVRRFGWSKKLNDLSDSVTPGIWIRDLSYDERAVLPPGSKGGRVSPKIAGPNHELKYLIISGYASSMGEQGASVVGKFMKSLKDNQDFYSDFRDIQLGSIRQDKVEDQEVMNFTITCLFKGQDGS